MEPYPVDLVIADVLTRTNRKTLIYTGVVKAYYLSGDGGLDSLLISNVRRRLIVQDGKLDCPKGCFFR